MAAVMALSLASPGYATSPEPPLADPTPADFSLPAGAGSSTLNNTSAGAPARPDPPARAATPPLPGLPSVGGPSVEPPVVVVPPPPAPLPSPPEVRTAPPPLPPAVEAAMPVPAPPIREVAPLPAGDSTMTRAIKPFGYHLILATALAAAPAIAADDKAPPVDDVAGKLEKLQKTLDKVGIKLDDLTTSTDLKIQKSQEKTQAEIADLKTQIGELRQEIEAIRKSLTGTTRTALSPPTTGRILLDNAYPTNMEFVVNGTSYVLRPYEQQEIKVPAGSFTLRIPAVPTYQVAQSRKLGTEKPYEIRVAPQQ